MNFWALYTSFYDKLNELIPYVEHKETIKRMIPSSPGFIVEMGCGTGNLMHNSEQYVGVDFSQAMMRKAISKLPRANFLLADLNKTLPFIDNSLSVVYSSNTLAYLTKPEKFVREIHRILKPGSLFIVATLRPTFSPFKIMKLHLRKGSKTKFISNLPFVLLLLLFNVPIVGRLRKGVYKGFELHSLRELLTDNGFTVLSSQLSYADQDVVAVGRKNG